MSFFVICLTLEMYKFNCHQKA